MWVLLGILKIVSKMLIKFLNPMFSIVKNGRISHDRNQAIATVMFRLFCEVNGNFDFGLE